MSATWAQKHPCIFSCVGSEAHATPSLQDSISSFVMVRKRKEDNRTESETVAAENTECALRERGKRDRRGRKFPKCIAKGCPAFGQRGWCGGYCKKCAPKYGRSRPVQVQKQKKAKVENTKNDEMGPPIEAKMEAQRKVTGEAIEKKCKVETPRTKNSEPRAQASQCASEHLICVSGDLKTACLTWLVHATLKLTKPNSEPSMYSREVSEVSRSSKP